METQIYSLRAKTPVWTALFGGVFFFSGCVLFLGLAKSAAQTGFLARRLEYVNIITHYI